MERKICQLPVFWCDAIRIDTFLQDFSAKLNFVDKHVMHLFSGTDAPCEIVVKVVRVLQRLERLQVQGNGVDKTVFDSFFAAEPVAERNVEQMAFTATADARDDFDHSVSGGTCQPLDVIRSRYHFSPQLSISVENHQVSKRNGV